MTRYRNRNNFQNTFKDYLVPIIGGVLLLTLLFSFIGGDDATSEVVINSENTSPVDIEFISEDTQAFIVYPGNERKEITATESAYKGETIIVTQGVVRLTFGNNNTIKLNKVAELKYNEDASLSFYSSDAWLNLAENTKISMKYATIESPSGSILSLTQNEAGSTVYVLSGSAKVTNLGQASTSLVSGQKISISRQFAADKDADLASDKGNIDSYFKSSDWFIENQGHLVLQDASNIITASGTTQGETGIYLSFDDILDEGNINTSTINISGDILSDSVELITINGKQAEITVSENRFSIDAVATNNSVNDIVVKIYDGSRAILEKKVITLYNTSPSSASSSNVTTLNSSSQGVTNSQGVTTYEVDGTDFGFTQPSVTGKFSTTGSEITIRGVTTADGISKVEVNGFELSSFNGSTWRYHAFERFETLEEGTNQYKVDYFGESGNILYTDYYTIVKKSPQTTTQNTTEDIISDEVEIVN